MIERPADPKKLRVFGLILGALLAFLGWRWGRKGWDAAPYLISAGAASAAVALARPLLLAHIERPWMRAARVVSRVMTFVILTALYYVLVTPYGLVWRLFSKDPLDLAMDGRTSYWKAKAPTSGPASYEREF